MGIVVFNSISSKDLGVEVETFPTYEVPEKVYQVISVPGRNGDVVVDTGTYKNVSRIYNVSIATYDRVPYHQKMGKVAEWLHSASGYAVLEDSYEPEFYRYAYYNNAVSIENLFNEAGRAEIEFICKPQRFYKDGDKPILFTSTGKIQNRTNFTSLPIINIKKNNTMGSVTIGDYTISIISNSGNNITVNSELQDAYYNTINKNSVIILDNGEFPKIKPGENIISFTGGIQSVEVIPKWWTI